MTDQIKKLAEEMNVSESDVLCFAQSMANGIEKDGWKEDFLSSGEDLQRDAIEAYAGVSVRKFEQFLSKTMTCREANNAFKLSVYRLLTK